MISGESIMKVVIKISLVLNAVLLASLVYSQIERRTTVGMLPPNQDAAAPARVVQLPVSSPLTTLTAAVAKFNWSQLQSTNYHVYVQNLRQAGCPEPSVRAIVTADVRAIFDKWRQEMEQTLTGIEAKPLAERLAAFNAEQAIQGKLQQLPAQEERMIADLLGEAGSIAPVAANGSAPATAPSARHRADQSDQPPVMPLAMQPVDLAALQLGPDQIQAINDLRESFLQKIGGTNQNPDDPAYLTRWRQAQPEIDTVMQGMIGDEAYQNYQVQANIAASTKSASPP